MSDVALQPRVAGYYKRDHDFPLGTATPRIRYVLATTPRSGSTLLSIYLWRTGQLGAPLEYLNLENARRNIEALGSGDLLTYWREIEKRRTSPNGVFGWKAFIKFLPQIGQRAPLILQEAAESSWIYLTREDRLAQAISYARAAQTQSWFADQTERSPPRYDPGLIRRALQSLDAQNAAWERRFAATGITPLRISFEDFATDRDLTVTKIGHHLNISIVPEVRIPTPLPQQQSDALSLEWRARYVAEKSGGDP